MNRKNTENAMAKYFSLLGFFKIILFLQMCIQNCFDAVNFVMWGFFSNIIKSLR